ncbi:MAG: exonuclease SbcCD subunit D [Chloroflexi bacterium]|nr:exonuclease SbcCD subunit D [Chloroflexota bacterium]
MRFLHTSDWHLGRQIRGQSRQAEFERVVMEVVDIARRERVDAVLIAGDTFDTFAPPPDAEKLLYEALTGLVRDHIDVVMIAGNHDHAQRMDAMTGILRIAGVHCVGSVPPDEGYEPVTLTSADGSEATTIVALPWVPERVAVEYERLFGELNEALQRYAGQMERAIAYFCKRFSPGTANVFLGHLFIGGSTVGEGSSERKLHIGQNFAVPASCLPGDAQYIALGHLHRPQEIAHASPAFYAGSLLQLDFGEEGQAKSVNIVEVHPRLPATVERVSVSGGRQLRTVCTTLDALPEHGGRYGDDFLRVVVELERPAIGLYERVRDVLPNALEVTASVAAQAAAAAEAAGDHTSVTPEVLLSRFYAQKPGGGAMPEGLLKLFSELYQQEVERATA